MRSFIFFLVIFWFNSAKSTIVSLAGNDWLINDNGSYSAQGQVPGTIHTILLAENKIPEPYAEYNDINLRYLIYRPWTFRKNFSLTDDFLTNTEFSLHFYQIDTVANVTLNECFLGRANNMFVAYTFNVSKSCLQANNQLRIDFESPVLYALNQAITYNDSVPPACVPAMYQGECLVQFMRKEPCSFSWDWAPAFAPIGITGDLYLQGTPATEIRIELETVNVAGYTTLAKNEWQIDVLLSSANNPFQSQLRFVLENTTFTYESTMMFNTTLAISLLIPKETVQLWWPNGYGEQTLYTLSVYNENKLIGQRSIGFRTVELVQQGYGPNINGTSFYFVINDQPIFVKGSNWVPPDAFQERVTDERLERLLRSAQLANLNMFRVWGGGRYERDSFYDMTDRLGIMLWHDFMFACSLYPVDELFLDNVRQEVIYQVKRLQSHASLVLWSGNNENEAAIAQNWYRVPPERIAKAKDDYRKLYVDTIMKTVKEMDAGRNRPFITSSPSNGLESIREDYIAKNPQDPLYGDVHFYGFTSDTWNPETYPITRFLSETGMNSLPSLDSWYHVTRNLTELQFQSDFMMHRRHDNKVDNLPRQIPSNLPIPVTSDSLKNFTHWIYLSQINQAMTMKSISDLCRMYSSVEMIDPKTSQGNTMGLMYWQIGDIWQAPTSSTVEYELKWKMGHYYIQHMYERVYPIAILTPYLANVTDENASIKLFVHNELFGGTQGRLTCSFQPLNTFDTKLSLSFDYAFNSSDLKMLAQLPYANLMKRAGCSASNQCLLHCRSNSSQEQIGQTLFLTQPKNYQLNQPNLRVENITQVSSTELSLTVTATQPALFVWLDVSANMSGYFSRNGFHMLETMRKVSFYSWTPMADFDRVHFDLRITSLFDVTEP